jgi:hypothetical protein
MRKISIIILSAIVSTVITASAQSKKLFTGKTYSIHLKVEGTERPGMSWTEDEIMFDGGKLISKVMGKNEGFAPFNCSFSIDSSSAEKKLLFNATGHNKGVSEIQWEGEIRGDTIAGKAVWTNAHGPQTHLFAGTVKKEK